MISFVQVGKTYPDGTVAVAATDLTADSGRITVLVGPSGSGKTTLLRMVNRMIEPTSGSILIDGVDVRSKPAPVLRRGIGYVIQNAGLFPHRTVLSNVMTVPRLLGWSKDKARDRAMELLLTVGLAQEHANRYPFQLSGGQQQRVGVARALAADPPVLLMDEPFSAVDPVVRKDLQTELLRMQSELEKTILFVTHDIDEAIQLGDKVAVLNTGGVLEQFDTPSELLAHPKNPFVESFLGVDRGVRRLSFFSSAEVPLRPEPVVPDGRAGRRGARRAGVRSPGCCSWTASASRWAGFRPQQVPRDGDLTKVPAEDLVSYGHTFAPRPIPCAPRWTPRSCRRPVARWASTTTARSWASPRWRSWCRRSGRRRTGAPRRPSTAASLVADQVGGPPAGEGDDGGSGPGRTSGDPAAWSPEIRSPAIPPVPARVGNLDSDHDGDHDGDTPETVDEVRGLVPPHPQLSGHLRFADPAAAHDGAAVGRCSG